MLVILCILKDASSLLFPLFPSLSFYLHKKKQVYVKFKEWYTYVTNKQQRNVKKVRSDRGGEYVSQMLGDFFRKKCILHEFTAGYSPEQNGVAEKKQSLVMEMAHTICVDAAMPKNRWPEAYSHAQEFIRMLKQLSIHCRPG